MGGLNNKFPEGVRGKGLRLISDNGSQPTSRAFMREMANLGIEQLFTFPPAVGQVMTILKEMQIQSACLSQAGMMRTIKEEVIWLHEFTSLTEAKEVIRDWIAKDNREYVHSALGYLSPLEFEQKFYQNYCQEAA